MSDSLVLDAETKAEEAPGAHKAETRLWLRLLTCTTMVEAEIRKRLRETFDTTLPRFDLMAQLERAGEDGLQLSDLSRRMMVTNGNVTHLVDRLVESEHVVRRTAEHDRRVHYVALSPQGRAAFEAMAAAHADWVAELFAGLKPSEIEALMRLLATTKASVGRLSTPKD